MFYLVQAMEDNTNVVFPSFTKLFSNKADARAYASRIVAHRRSFVFAEITELEVECDALSSLTEEEYELATTPV